MSFARTFLLSVLIIGHGVLGSSTLWAQASSGASKPASHAVIEGIVMKEPGGEPVKKALIELIAENQAEGGDYTAVSGGDGSFHIEGIEPGRYHLFAERSGFLEVDKHHAPTDGRVLTLAAGQEVKDVLIRLQAAAVVRGRVTDEDGDAMANAQVTVLRQSFASGRSRWEQAGSERTNDLGEYRIANLPAGNYYVSVSPPPDFKSLIEAAGNIAARTEQGSGQANAAEKSAALSYQTTYYPGTPDRGQAAPIQLKAGDDFPVDFSLSPSPALSIRGSIVNLPPHASAVITLQSHDFNLMLNGAEVRKDGSFVIRDVAPGAYTILATVENAAVPMMARQSLQVAGSVEDLRLAPQPGGWIHGRLRLENKSNSRIDPGELFLMLRAVDGDDDLLGAFSFRDSFSNIAHVAPDGSFEWRSVPPGGYYVQFAGAGLGPDWYLKSVLVGGRDADEAGVNVNGGAVTLDLVASANGTVLDGAVTDKNGEPVANTLIVAVPETRLRGRMDRYYKTVSDQSGRFTLQGVAPGDYTLFAWESVEGEAYYNAEFMKSYEGQGSALHAGDGERKSVSLQVIPEAEAQP
jgi:protocatechuate 3,4-dioxygenase beta subunit